MQKLLTKGIGHTKFKKTEFGEIPEEWEIVELEKCIRETIKDGTHSTPKYVDEGVPFITVANLGGGKINFDTCKKITPEEHAELSKRTKPEKGDILLSKVGTLGLAIKIDTDREFSIFVQVALIKPNKNVDSDFLKYQILSPLIQKQISEKSSQSTLKFIGIGTISKLKLLIPLLHEQQKIASVLSKVDSQIQDNQNYLARLQELKKGLMQDLLTGKVRV